MATSPWTPVNEASAWTPVNELPASGPLPNPDINKIPAGYMAMTNKKTNQLEVLPRDEAIKGKIAGTHDIGTPQPTRWQSGMDAVKQSIMQPFQLGGGAVRETGSAIQGLGQTFGAPPQTADEKAAAMAGPGAVGLLRMGKGYVGSVQENVNKANAAGDQGKPWTAVGRSAAAGLPLVGPLVGRAMDVGEQIQSGDISPEQGMGRGASLIGQVMSMAPEGSVIPNPVTALARGAGPVLDAANRVRGAAAEVVVKPLVRKPLGATLEDTKFNRDPAAGLVKEGLFGTKSQLVTKTEARIGELAKATDATLKNHPNANVQIDAKPIIDKAVDGAVSSAKKVGNQSSVKRLEDLRAALKNEYGATKGTPAEINALKQEVGKQAHDLGAFKSTDPLEASAAGAMRDVYGGLKDAINKAVPEVAPLNERVANLISAKTALNRNLALQENKSFLSGLDATKLPFQMAGKVADSGIARSGLAKVLNMGNALDVPKTASQPPSGFPRSVASPATAKSPAPEFGGDVFEKKYAGQFTEKSGTVDPSVFLKNVKSPEFLGAGGTSPARIEALEQAYRAGKKVDPVKVYVDENNNFLGADGRHRASAAINAGVKRVPIIVRRVKQ